MKITRFAQSCLLVETRRKRILIDPGAILFKESYPRNEWSDIDAILVTHRHEDHCHADAIKEILKNPKTKFYSSQEVAHSHPELSLEVVKEDDRITLDNVNVEVVKAVHGWIPPFKEGKGIKENIAFIIDDGTHRAYQTSDTICFENNYTCDVIFLPVTDHGIVMGPWDAALFAKETGAKLAIPIHYDSPKHPADFSAVKKEFEAQNLNYKFLEIGESVEL